MSISRGNKGMVYVFTGEGKGKTSAGLGVVVRSLSHGMKVGWVSWYKQKIASEKLLADRVEMYAIGRGFYKLPGDKVSEEEHKRAAQEALKKARELIKRVDVLVLDEVNNAVKDGLVELGDIVDLISKQGKVHLVLTGRDVDKKIVELVDLVTEMRKIKHPFDKGGKAVKGLDY